MTASAHSGVFAGLRPPYGAIHADPPWRFETWGGADGNHRGAEQHYPTLDSEALQALPVAELAARDCALFLWIVDSHLAQALELMAAWGFGFKTVAFVWVKTRPGSTCGLRASMGYWTRKDCELCLLGTRGAPRRQHKDVWQAIVAPKREHSRKPDEAARRIERLVPGPYCELFARAPRPGWDVWGNQVDRFDPAARLQSAPGGPAQADLVQWLEARG